MRESQVQFIRQQGFPDEDASEGLYVALMFQPRVIGTLVAFGVFFQSAWLFLALSAVLVWSTLVPTHSPFDAFYNRFIAQPRGRTPLGVAPAPRRFAQGMAAAVTLTVGIALVFGAAKTAWLVEALMAISVAAVVLRDLCGPANLYHVVRGMLTRPHSHATGAGRSC
jgi:hypothetical protein